MDTPVTWGDLIWYVFLAWLVLTIVLPVVIRLFTHP